MSHGYLHHSTNIIHHCSYQFGFYLSLKNYLHLCYHTCNYDTRNGDALDCGACPLAFEGDSSVVYQYARCLVLWIYGYTTNRRSAILLCLVFTSGRDGQVLGKFGYSLHIQVNTIPII